jgi:hypothetical protein
MLAQKEEVTKEDDADIPYQLLNFRLTRLWDSDIMPPSIQKPAEVVGQNFALHFWKMKLRRTYFAWLGEEYHFREKTRPVAIWDGSKYTWGEKHNASLILIALTQFQLTQTRDNRRAATIHRAHLGAMLVSVLHRHPYGGWAGEEHYGGNHCVENPLQPQGIEPGACC